MITYKECVVGGEMVHTCDPCLLPELGKVRSFCLIKKGTAVTAPFDLTEWTAAVESGDIIIIPESTGTFDGGTPKMGAGYGNKNERKLGDDYVLAVSDPTYLDNTEFWEAAEKETWNIAYRTEKVLHIVDADVTIAASAPVEADVDSEVVWNINATWFSKEKPKASLFEPIKSLFKCFEVTT